MKKIKDILFHFTMALIIGSLFVLSQAQVRDDQPIDLSGFSGYAWGASMDFIVDTMQDEGYDLISNSSKDLWYRGKIAGEVLQIVYYFENQILTSGMWVLDDVDLESYWKVNEHLRNAYNSKARLKLKGDDWIESEMEPKGTDAWIIHRLDIEKDRHVVHYYFRRGED